MPLILTPQNHFPVCTLQEWQVADQSELVKILAWLYVRKPKHAAKIIDKLAPGAAAFPGAEFVQARRLLSWEDADLLAPLADPDPDVRAAAEVKRDKRIEQRDGLLFQHISWIAARLSFPASHLSAPHVRKADKGFDGVLVQVGGTGIVASVILCEDKATTNPRNLVTQSIWQEIRAIEMGEKDLEIQDAVTALLDRVDGADVDAALKGISWDRVRQYRVALTAPQAVQKPAGYGHLFDGFDTVTARTVDARMADYLALVDVRAFLRDLAEQVKDALIDMEAEHV